MDRTIVYPGAIPLDVDLLQPEQSIMVALGYALQASYAQNTVVVGLACNATSPASMQITVGPGAIVTPTVIETTPFGSIPSDSTDPLVKMGINISSTAFTLSAPTTPGQSQNYLIQCSFSEADDTPATLTYFNSLNPQQPFTGPQNSGTPQNTRRAQRANLQVKVGGPANTGTQVTPPVDAGWTGLYVITVSYGQTAVVSSSISTYPNAPFLAAFLQSHHGGVPGQAPKINLATEVQGVLAASNLPTGVGANLSFAGNPNAHVAGTAAAGSSPPSLCWDTVDYQWWTCISTGTTSTAVWVLADNTQGMQAFASQGTFTFTVPAGVTRVEVSVTGGGGGGSAANGHFPPSTSNDVSGGGGGAGGTAIGIYSVAPGQAVPVVVGSGGASQANGASSSFGGFCSATGGQGASFTSVAVSAGGQGGIGSGGQINLSGGWGGDGQESAAAFSGYGGTSYWGGGTRAEAGTLLPPTGAPGSGGGGVYDTASSLNGSAGIAGIVVVKW